MEAKRKIVIPVGGRAEAGELSPAQSFDGGETVPAPLFDEEATISARPVVPLAPEVAQGRGDAGGPLAGRFPLLALVVILAIAAGVAGGFAIGIYKSRQSQQQATTTPAATTTAADTSSSQSSALPGAVVASEGSTATERARPVERQTETEARATSKPARDEKLTPPVEIAEPARDKRTRAARDGGERKETVVNDSSSEEREEARRQRREERREQRRRARKVDEYEIPQQQVERANRELNRIREIFEGPRP